MVVWCWPPYVNMIFVIFSVNFFFPIFQKGPKIYKNSPKIEICFLNYDIKFDFLLCNKIYKIFKLFIFKHDHIINKWLYESSFDINCNNQDLLISLTYLLHSLIHDMNWSWVITHAITYKYGIVTSVKRNYYMINIFI